MMLISVIALVFGPKIAGAMDPVAPYVNLGTVSAVEDLLDRQLPGAKSHFVFAIDTKGCVGGVAPPCFSLADGPGGVVEITATGAAELASGLGYFLRERCNMVIGWPRGGGSNLFIPAVWPKVGKSVAVRRNTPWSYIMNVCTHSYSLVWYSWGDWQNFIDWMAMSGINLFLAMTGQEEVQYKVFQKFGLTDAEIRNWFNGPALLTWSRGQNEYGSDLGGPLPRSWMKQQWELQRNITKRYRSLGMTAQLPAFQGNVPVQLRDRQHDTNITKAGDTGWMNSVDPLYAKIADEWMKTLIADFGTDHWYQLDGYFNGGTAPWMKEALHPADSLAPPAPKCAWGPRTPDTYSFKCADSGCGSHASVAEAQAACVADVSCSAITSTNGKRGWQLRQGRQLKKSPINEVSYLITNAAECHVIPNRDDPSWTERGVAAYTGLNRTDPAAIWSFQGWAIVGWHTDKQRNSVKSFIDATPKGKFNLIDMSVNGDGEWKKWNNGQGLWGNENDHANYIWTTLHDFGGTDGLKGDLGRINHIPFDGIAAKTNVWGTGFTPEGIDQNPVYYEFMLETNWRTEPVANITQHIVERSQRRYNLTAPNAGVTNAWSLLVQSAYSQDLSVQDGTGVPHLGSEENWSFEKDQRTPTATMCQIYNAWESLLDASADIAPSEPFRYDLVNLGREVLAQLAGPAGHNFTTAIGKGHMVAGDVTATGKFYMQVLNDLDTLVATDTAFLIGPWIAMAKKFADGGATDCTPANAASYPTVTTCAHFYEWSARSQLTSWKPTPMNAAKIPGGPIDYASKHWSGLVRDYYAARVGIVMDQALSDAKAGRPLNGAKVNSLKAELAYKWTTSTSPYPVEVTGDFAKVSKMMHQKYQHYFAAC